MEDKRVRISKYSALSFLYFFFNGVGLPFGLLYTNLLSPFFYLWLLFKKKQPVLLQFFMFLIPFDIIHLVNGVELKSFFISNLLFISTYIFVACFYYFINHYDKIERIFKQILIANFFFTLLAIILYFTSYRDYVWYVNQFTVSVRKFYRLSLLTYEASYYSTLLVPIAYYYFLNAFFKNNKNSGYALLLVLIPLLLSLSLGVIGATLLSFAILYLFHWKKIFYKKRFFYTFVILLFSLVTIFVVLLIIYSNNPLFIRVNNIFSGDDTSGNGRTIESFTMAYKIAQERSIWFGSGLGQIKLLASEIVRRYYNYWGELAVIRIPNTTAETLAIFGIFGLIVRFALIFYLFFKTRVLSNYYRTVLFLFIFIYQLTGSYLTNIAEYVIWCIAFSSAFPQFDVKMHKEFIPSTLPK